MKLILAQGNPGTEFSLTRHNIGFYMADQLAKEMGGSFTPKPKFHADIAEVLLDGEKLLLVKPTTYYNETGRAARALVDFYKIDPSKDLLVIHDDLALPFGTIRTRPSGSDAGNNGIKSLNTHLGQQYARIRVGIYNQLRDQIPDADFVLAKFSAEEAGKMWELYEGAKQFIKAFASGDFPSTKISL